MSGDRRTLARLLASRAAALAKPEGDVLGPVAETVTAQAIAAIALWMTDGGPEPAAATPTPVADVPSLADAPVGAVATDSDGDVAVRDPGGEWAYWNSREHPEAMIRYGAVITHIPVPVAELARLRSLAEHVATPMPAPFVRGVDELTDDEVLAAIEEAQGRPTTITPETATAQARDLYDALTTRMRVDGAVRTATTSPPVAVTVAMLVAAPAQAVVTDKDGDVWQKATSGDWEAADSVPLSSARLSTFYGPLRDLAAPGVATERVEQAPVPAIPTGDDTATRDALTVAVLERAAAFWAPTEGAGRNDRRLEAHAAIDAAARAHVATLDGEPAPPAAPLLAVTDDDVDAARQTLRESGEGGLRGRVRRVLEAHNARLADRAPGGYDPVALASGSAVLAEGSLWVKTESETYENFAWHQIPGSVCRSRHVPRDGILLVDGATLGGDR